MIPFKTARINGRNWSITVLDKIDHSEECIGLCDHETRKIMLESGSKGKLQDSLFHEMVHAACPSLTEEQVMEVERGVFAVLADNPKIRRWLFSNEAS